MGFFKKVGKALRPKSIHKKVKKSVKTVAKSRKKVHKATGADKLESKGKKIARKRVKKHVGRVSKLAPGKTPGKAKATRGSGAGLIPAKRAKKPVSKTSGGYSKGRPQ